MDLGERAYYSVVGKAIIGVIGGTLVLLVASLRYCNQQNSNNAQNEWILKKIETIRYSNSDTISDFFSNKVSDDSINNLMQKLKSTNFQWQKSLIKHQYEFTEKRDIKEKFVFISNQNTNDSCVIFLGELGKIIGLEFYGSASQSF